MVDRAKMAVTKWIPYSSAGAAISFVVGFAFGLPPAQVIVPAAMTAALIFSGLFPVARKGERAAASPPLIFSSSGNKVPVNF